MSGGLFFTLVILAFVVGFVWWVGHSVKQARDAAAEEKRERAAEAARQAAEAARQAAEAEERRAAHAAMVEAERQAEAKRVAAALADALVARGVTVAERCVRCGQIFTPDARGACTSCGAPPAVKP